MYQAKHKIDTENELNHLIEFTQARWQDTGDIKDIITHVWNATMPQVKNVFDQYSLTEPLAQIMEDRKNPAKWPTLSKEEVNLVPIYDAIYSFASECLSSARDVYEIIIKEQWNYSKLTTKLTSEIKEQFKDTAKIKPLGWNELAKNYSDFDGQQEYCNTQQDKDTKDFKGCNSDGAAASGFHGRIVLPYVMYDDKCQGRKPLYTLIGAVIAHAFFVASHNNSIDLKNNILKIKEYFDKPEYYSKLQRTIDVEPLIENKILQAIVAIRQQEPESEEEFNQAIKKSLESKAKFSKLTPEEKEAKNVEQKKWVNELINSIKDPSAEEITKEKTKKLHEKEVCLSILNGTEKRKAKP